MLWLPQRHGEKAITIRRAGPQDAAAIARVYVDSWRETYAGHIPQRYLDNLSYTTFERHWRRTFTARGWAFVAETDGRIVGLSSGGRCRRQSLAQGEIYVLYLLKAWHGRGIGRALFDACHFDLARRGYSGTLVWVLESNPTRGFYEALGGTQTAQGEVTIAGIKLKEVGYHWPD